MAQNSWRHGPCAAAPGPGAGGDGQPASPIGRASPATRLHCGHRRLARCRRPRRRRMLSSSPRSAARAGGAAPGSSRGRRAARDRPHTPRRSRSSAHRERASPSPREDQDTGPSRQGPTVDREATKPYPKLTFDSSSVGGKVPLRQERGLRLGRRSRTHVDDLARAFVRRGSQQPPQDGERDEVDE